MRGLLGSWVSLCAPEGVWTQAVVDWKADVSAGQRGFAEAEGGQSCSRPD